MRSELLLKEKIKSMVFNINKFADELLEVEPLTQLAKQVKTMQRNWIGKSFGCERF